MMTVGVPTVAIKGVELPDRGFNIYRRGGSEPVTPPAILNGILLQSGEPLLLQNGDAILLQS